MTQCIWHNSYLLGCALVRGMPMYDRYWVCQYGYGGNFGSQLVYTAGPSCSQCPTGFGQCENKLCTSGTGQPTTPQAPTPQPTPEPTLAPDPESVRAPPPSSASSPPCLSDPPSTCISVLAEPRQAGHRCPSDQTASCQRCRAYAWTPVSQAGARYLSPIHQFRI